MTARITTLTPAQAELLPKFRDEWLARGLATGPCDHEAIEAAVRKVYEGAGRKPPEIVIWMGSPLGGCFASAVLAELGKNSQLWDQLGDQLWGQLRGQLRGQLWGQLGGQLWGQLGGQLWDQLWGQLWDQLWGQLWGQLGGQLWGQLRDQLWGQLGDQLWDQLRGQLWGQLRGQLGDQLWDQLRGQLWDQLRDQLNYAMYGQHDIPWVAWWTFARSIGVTLTDTQNRWLDGMGGLADCGWCWPMDGAVILTERPSLIEWDTDNRLHCETGPAVLYPDGFGLWAIHGVRVPAIVVEHPEMITSEMVLAEPNQEIRRVMADRHGWDRLAEEGGWKLIDCCDDPGNPGQVLRLWDLPAGLNAPTGDPRNGTVRLVTCTNGSVDRDGTRRRFGLTVDAKHSDAVGAVAASYRMTKKEYAGLARRC